jgi:bifunctional UDP-N-acetylglucosamine pyrophosphorylase / glucosamine-1-phosphate N-acetyltransferase
MRQWNRRPGVCESDPPAGRKGLPGKAGRKGRSLASRRPPRSLAVVALAAGKGKRMKSATPKVLHQVCGRPSLWHVITAALPSKPETLVVVVGHEPDHVRESVESWELAPAPVFVDQGDPLGTGHAVAATESDVQGADDVLILAGDDPLVSSDHVKELLKVHRRTRAAATILTTFLNRPKGYGRVVREGNELIGIVEEADASAGVRRIREVSTLVYAFRREDLFRALPLVGRENSQNEYYLPDVLKVLKEKGETVSAVPVDMGGALGLNSRGGLATVARILRTRIVERHMANGVTFVDPANTYVDVDVRIGHDSVIQPLTFLQGVTLVGARCTIGPATRIVDSTVGDDAEVAFSVVRDSRIGRRVEVGPYASIRPGTVLEDDAKAGTFVELKKTRVGRGSKVPHLSYMGDATIGRGSNVGAGSITCNYDGYDKHPTVIGNEAFIGSDTMLVAPVTVGDRAWTAAGSAITKDVAPGTLAVERSDQRSVKGYDQRKRRAHGGRPPGGGSKAGGRVPRGGNGSE